MRGAALIVEPWWQRIRGARAISWQSVVIGDLLISFAIVASGGTLGGYAAEPGAQSRALLAVCATGFFAAAWALIGFRLLFKDRHIRPVSLWTYALFYVTNGVIYFLTVQWLESVSGSPSGIGWPARLLSSMAISLVWGIAISLLLENSDRFRTQRQSLLNEMVEVESRRLRESQEIVHLREALDKQIDEVLTSTRDRLGQALMSSQGQRRKLEAADVEAAVAVVRSAASDVVRPLSHKLLEQAQASFPEPRFSGVLHQWWMHPRMPPLATALLVSTQTTAESVRNFGGILGPLAGFAYFAVLYLFLVLIDRASNRFPTSIRPIYLIGVIGGLALNLTYSEGFSPEGLDVGDATANVLLSFVYIVITSLADALRRAREGLLDSLESQISNEELRARALETETGALVDSVARKLHGRVQTQLVVCAAELERASDAGDYQSIMRALLEASAALESATHPRTLSLAEVVEAWGSVLSVEVMTEGVALEEIERSDVVAVVEEGLANAHRHGLAANASVTLMCISDALRVVVVDDGVGRADGVPGLGTSLIRRLSHDRMTLEQGASGTTLTVDLPPCGGGGY